ncbi:hypothetical protein [Francisella salimarina]|uniref:hypothetical protein n=1 Tax=Francisella salimarina TaxID=2599927 RepID=UPI003D81C200
MLKRYFIFYLFFYICNPLSLYADDKSSEDESLKNVTKGSNAAMAIQDVEMQEAQGLTKEEEVSILDDTTDHLINSNFFDKYINKEPIQTSFFNGIRVNHTLGHAMLNPNYSTAKPLFMLKARKTGIIDDNYVYIGGKTAFIDWNRVGRNNNGGVSKSFSYYAEGFAATTISKWVSTFMSLSILNENQGLRIVPYNLYFIVGDLSESPYFGYIANSQVTYGNFDMLVSMVSPVTRLYFMQSGGNANISYHTDSFHLNAVLLNSNPNSFYGVTNADSKGGIGFSLNSKYTYEMDTLGEYQFVGLAYSNVSGFNSKNGGTVGSIDINYGAYISNITLALEGVITDKGVSGVNSSSAISDNHISDVPFFGSIRPNSRLIYEDFLTSGDVVSSWSAQSSYTYTFHEKPIIPYVGYSHLLQNSDNYAYEVSVGVSSKPIFDSWIGLDYSNITTKSPTFTSRQNYVSLYWSTYI